MPEIIVMYFLVNFAYPYMAVQTISKAQKDRLFKHKNKKKHGIMMYKYMEENKKKNLGKFQFIIIMQLAQVHQCMSMLLMLNGGK